MNKKKYLIILMAIALVFTGCTKDANESKELAYYAFDLPTTESSTNYQDVIKESGSNTFLKLEGEQLSICIYRNDTLECFKNNNYEEESIHLQNVFAANFCSSSSSSVNCHDDTFSCLVTDYGRVHCHDLVSNLYCSINSDGYVRCI